MITNVSAHNALRDVYSKVREIFHFPGDQPVTLKWIDEEEDPCVLSSDAEFKEAIRLYFLNRECQLTVLVYGGVPAGPGKPCPGEDLMYRRGAKRWKQKFYVSQGHKFAARRFTKTTQCIYCHGRIWGLGQSGFKCIKCHLLLHRRCQGCIQHKCGDPIILPGTRPESANQPWIVRMEPRPSSPSLSEKLSDNGMPSSQLRPMSNEYSHQSEAYTLTIPFGRMDEVETTSKSITFERSTERVGPMEKTETMRRNTRIQHDIHPTEKLGGNNFVPKNITYDSGVERGTHYVPYSDSSVTTSHQQVIDIIPNTRKEARPEPALLDNISNAQDSVRTNSSIGHGNSSIKNEILINGQRILSPALAPNATPTPGIPSSDESVGLQNFRLLKVIGRGSYAKVFQVEHIPTSRVYAMKVIKKETILEDEDIEWVQTEKHVFECATNYPFLVGLHSCFQTDSRLFFVIEFVNGGDLMYFMQRNLRLTDDYARFYAAEISAALNFLHEHGIIYRDLKLDNVLMDHEGHIKLTDYGMCKEGMFGDALTNTFCGTPSYLAPEILRNEPYNRSVDWWSLGVLLFEFLAGRSPWEDVGQSTNPDQNTESYLMHVILERPIRIPRMMSVQSGNILRALLVKFPSQRLGCPPHSSFADIMNHPFFKTIDWVALEQKQIPPPYRPTVDSDYDMINFDPTFTDEPVVFTPDNEKLMAKIDQSEYECFEYVNPLLMSLDVAV